MSYKQSRNYENLQKRIFNGVGPYDIPALEPVTLDTIPEFIGFNYARGCDEPEAHGVHFFVDDYQFIRLWTNPDNYLNMLGRFACVATPDFSTYTDFPKAVQVYNHYRKHWLGAYWQEHGVTVVPTISWSDESSFEWCFDGEPVGGAVAVSSVGTQMNKRTAELFRHGYSEMIQRLSPSQILFCGAVPDNLESGGEIIRITTFQDRLRAYDRPRKDVE